LEAVARGTLGASGLSLVAALSACSPSAAPAVSQPQFRPAPVAVTQAQQTQPVGTRMPQSDGDLCKASEMQWLVGRPRAEIPVPVDVVNRRVACTTCPVTEDYSPYRLNIFYNRQTELIEQVRCG